MVDQPVLSCRHARAVVGIGIDPGWRALEHHDLAGLSGDLGHELHGAGAGSDDRYPLVRKVESGVPARRVKRRAFERAHAIEIGKPGLVELSRGTDESIGLQHVGVAVAVPDRHAPCAARLVEIGPGGLVLEQDMTAQTKIGRAAFKVRIEDRLRAVVLRPVVTGERVLVDMARVVDAATGIEVVMPCAADIGATLDDGKGDPRLLEPISSEQSRHAGADDNDMEAVPDSLGNGVEPAHSVGIIGLELGFVHQEPDAVFVEFLPGDEPQDLSQCFRSERWRRRTAAVAVLGQRLKRHGSYDGLLLSADAALQVARAAVVDPDVATKQFDVPGEVDERSQRHRRVGMLQCVPDGVVVVTDRLPVEMASSGHDAPLPGGPSRAPS